MDVSRFFMVSVLHEDRPATVTLVSVFRGYELM